MRKSVLIMVRSFLILSFFFLVSLTARSQYLYFCEDIDANSDPVNKATTFTINPEGGYLYFYCEVGHDVNCNQIHYSIYSLDEYGNEVYENAIYQDVEPTWAYFWKKINFYHAGDYNVYVYDNNYNLLASGSIRIKI